MGGLLSKKITTLKIICRGIWIEKKTVGYVFIHYFAFGKSEEFRLFVFNKENSFVCFGHHRVLTLIPLSKLL